MNTRTATGRGLAVVLVALALVALSVAAALAAPGDPDSTFDGDGDSDGWVRTNVGQTPSGNNAGVRGMAVQSDGKVVVAGTNGEDFLLARYTTAGALDPTFGNGGFVTTDIGADSADAAHAVTLDGTKIVAVGRSAVGNDSDFALARYNADGTLDASFGGDGKVSTDLNAGSFDEANAVAVSGTDLIVAGFTASGGSFEFALARYNADGSLDTGFDPVDDDGTVVTDLGGTDQANAVTVQGDGKIVAAGITTDVATGVDFGLARYHPNGALDTNADTDPATHFDTDGIVTTDLQSGSSDQAVALATVDDGKLLAGGSASNDFALARYNPNGSLDTDADGDTTEFGTDGKVLTDVEGGSLDNAAAMAVQEDDKIVLAGGIQTNATFIDDFAVARYNANGSPDTGFDADGDDDGDVVTDLGSDLEVAYAVGLTAGPSQQAIAAGTSGNDFALVKYTTSGGLDNSFDGDGKVTTPVTRRSGEFAEGVAIQDDGKIVVAGDTDAGDLGDSDFVVARYEASGALDSSFGTNGVVTTDFGSDSSDGADGVAVQPNGKVVVAGTSDGRFAVARYDSEGSPDPSFDTDGKLTTPIGLSGAARAVVVQPDGKIVAAGESFDGTSGDFALARYNDDGSLDTDAGTDGDPEFGTGGTVVTDIGVGSTDEANAVAIQTDGKIVAAGRTNDGSNDDFALARYNPDGSPDTDLDGDTTTFDTDGKVTTDIGTATTDTANAVALQPDGKIVATGTTQDAEADFATVRYGAGGAPDAGFGTAGIAITDIGPEGSPPECTEDCEPNPDTDDGATGVAVEANGKVVAGGFSEDGIALVRYTAAGAADVQFGPGVTPDTEGEVVDDLASGSGAFANAIASQGDDRIVAAGGIGNDIVVARYLSGDAATPTPGPGPGPEPEPEPDPGSGGAGPPDTRIDKAKVKKTKGKAKFTFSGSGGTGQLGFQCELDDGGFSACGSPQGYKKLDRGKHTFEVRAVGADGQPDPTPATQAFKSKRRG